MAFRNIECDDGVKAEIYLCAVSGTHSSGKTTLLESFGGEEYTEKFGVKEDDPYNLLPQYTGGTLEGTNVPIITGEEAMTAYARINRLPDLATTDYSFEHQIAVEALSWGITVDSLDIAVGAATRMQPEARVRQGIILVDRSALDGFVYSSLRTDNDQELVNMRQVDFSTIGWDSNPAAENRTWPFREWSRGLMREHCDIAFITDHTEVEIEDDGFRQTEEEFREDAANLMMDYYGSVLGDRVKILQGSPGERKATVTAAMLDLIAA